MDIKDGTLEGFCEILLIYGSNLDNLANLWIGLSTDEDDEDDTPPEVWISDARPVQELSKILSKASYDLQRVWENMPVDLRGTVNIKIRKVKKPREAT